MFLLLGLLVALWVSPLLFCKLFWHMIISMSQGPKSIWSRFIWSAVLLLLLFSFNQFCSQGYLAPPILVWKMLASNHSFAGNAIFFFSVHSYSLSFFPFNQNVQGRRLLPSNFFQIGVKTEFSISWKHSCHHPSCISSSPVLHQLLSILPNSGSSLVERFVSFMPSVLWAVLGQVPSQPLPWWISDSIVWQDQMGLMGYMGSKNGLSIVLMVTSSRDVWVEKRRHPFSAVLLEFRIEDRAWGG